jgi:hypothetical protein
MHHNHYHAGGSTRKSLSGTANGLGAPDLQDFERELLRFSKVEGEISAVEPARCVGALVLLTANLKLQLRSESRAWKVRMHAYSHCIVLLYIFLALVLHSSSTLFVMCVAYGSDLLLLARSVAWTL